MERKTWPQVWKGYTDVYIHTADLQIRRGQVAADEYLWMVQGMNVTNEKWRCLCTEMLRETWRQGLSVKETLLFIVVNFILWFASSIGYIPSIFRNVFSARRSGYKAMHERLMQNPCSDCTVNCVMW